ncbi:hypothetical protein VTK73DRAFT_7237 [Phialemonium thermophilum]|uniref:Uncharacterized protein n=1 Tax=Phialemonium thermophilum TaxID=223376 RepID=A0ABR3XU53_9PEZI
MAVMEAANFHHGQQQPYPSLPASPTLTNPDMILPDYDRAASPDPDLDTRSHSPLMMWKNAHATGPAGILEPGQQHPDHPYGPTGPITPTTPIIYGNGTMLSDIGEVTEVESTPGKASPVRSRLVQQARPSPVHANGSDTALRSSPTMGLDGLPKRRSKQITVMQRERRSSMESTSTVTTQEKQDLFADFDDSISVDDSVFQGDDEESVADSYIDYTPEREDNARLDVPYTDNTDRLSTYSMSTLSRRAEHILANAKKRLTTMEGNLSRARSSLYVTTPSLSSQGSDGSTPSPPTKRASTATFTRSSDSLSPTFPSNQTRVSHDDAFSSEQRDVAQQRSASALGVSGGYRHPLASSKSVGHIPSSLNGHYRALRLPRDRTLEPLGEDDVLAQESDTSMRIAKDEQLMTPTFGSFSDGNNSGGRPLHRSASVAQMRDLKDQVKDLKGKISSLREQARADSLKRRSLQSLRTPSPFTHARMDQWYAGAPRSRLSTEIGVVNPATARNPWNGELSSVDGDEHVVETEDENFAEGQDRDTYAEGEDESQVRTPRGQSPESVLSGEPVAGDAAVGAAVGDNESDMQTEDGRIEDADDAASIPPEGEADKDYESESGESLYHDTLQHPISHEDREDAFDYEHFFLHSAMGTISQQRLARNGSRSSFSSEDSVETTRGLVVEGESGLDVEDDEIPATRGRPRRKSDASISTVETFATADEGFVGSVHRTDGSSGSPRGRSSFISVKGRPKSPVLTKRTSTTSSGDFRSSSRPSTSRHSTGSIVSIPEETSEIQDSVSGFNYYTSTARRSTTGSVGTSLHRPSVSSFESTGTNRSFPLVNRPKNTSNSAVQTSDSSSPDQELKVLSDSLLNETASTLRQHQEEDIHDSGIPRSDNGTLLGHSKTPQTLQCLTRDDQYLVERLVSSLGRCVLGLSENGKASTESRIYRRRLDAARRILEGLERI